jgi:hypothetical protein
MQFTFRLVCCYNDDQAEEESYNNRRRKRHRRRHHQDLVGDDNNDVVEGGTSTFSEIHSRQENFSTPWKSDEAISVAVPEAVT